MKSVNKKGLFWHFWVLLFAMLLQTCSIPTVQEIEEQKRLKVYAQGEGLFETEKLRQKANQRILKIKEDCGFYVIYDVKFKPFFPYSWYTENSNAKVVQLEIKQFDRALTGVEKFCKGYTKKLVKNLHHFYIMKSMSFYNTWAWGGTRSSNDIYITLKAYYTEEGFTSLAHKEFSSILFLKYPFPKEEWRSITPKHQFTGTGVEMLGKKNLLTEDKELMKQGFIYKYAKSSVENDYNCLIKYVMVAPKKLVAMVNQYPKIRRKAELTVEFLMSIDPEMKIHPELATALKG